MKKLISSVLFCLLSFCSFTQVTWDALGGPRGIDINELKTGPDESIFILSNSFDQVYRSLNGGINWEELALPEEFYIEDWAVDADGSVYVKEFDQILRIGLDETAYTVLPTLPTFGISIAVADDGTLLFTGNNSIYYLPPGAPEWVDFTHDEGNLSSTRIIAGTGDVHYLSSTNFVNSKIYRLNLTSGSFNQVFNLNVSFADVVYHPVSGLWVIDGNSKLYNSTDEGENWQEAPTPPAAQFTNIHFGAGERIFLRYTLFSPLHYTSTDNGQTWTGSLDLLEETIIGPSVALLSDGSELYYHTAYNQYMLLKSTDQGQSFVDLLLNAQRPDLQQLIDAGADRLLAKTSNLDMQWSLDNGQSWARLRTNDDQAIPLQATVRALDGNLVAIGAYQQVYRSLDAGDTWENITPSNGISGNLYAESIAALDQDRILIVSSDGSSYYTANGGLDWLTDEIPQFDNRIVAHPAGIFINYSTNSTFYRAYQTNTNSWVTQNLEGIQEVGSFQVIVMADERVIFYFPGDSLTVGRLYISEDLGETFTASYPSPDLNPFSRIDIKVNKVNELFFLHEETIYKSSTDGENWITFAENLPGGRRDNPFLFIDEKDYLYFQAQNDLVYRTEAPTASTNFISGHLWSDNNLDCTLQEEDEFDLSGWIVKATNENGTYYSHTDANGDYLLNAPVGDYQVEAVINNPLYDACNSAIPVSLSVGDTVEMVDFPLQPNTFCSLLRPLVSTPFMRRCFDNTFSVSVSNEGNIAAENATVTVQLDDFLAFESADLPLLSQDGQNYTFALGTVLPGQLIEFSLLAYLSCDTKLGQENCVLLNTTPGNECAPDYVPDSYQECQANIGSFDPNDKRAFVDGREVSEYLLPGTERLTYHIRFQNTGTDTAFTVVVEDVLPTEMDATTFRLEGNSHPVRVDFPYNSAVAATTVHFIFDDIMLVDSFTNEPASHGFVKFSMAPNNDLELGTVIDNYADIFFDFNEPIRTNTNALVYDFSSSTNNLLDRRWQIKAYPNPFNSSIQLQLTQQRPLSAIYCDWFNAQGQLVDQQIMQNGQLRWERPDLPAGLYSYRLRSNTHFLIGGKVIKQDH